MHTRIEATKTVAGAPPMVWLVGDAGYADFREAIELLRATATVIPFADAAHAAADVNSSERHPDLILFAASRPGIMRVRDVERLRQCVPLAGMVALLGSWCEGEARTGRPVAGVLRCYWYDFPNWWRRQLAMRAAGSCPDWARPATADARDWPVNFSPQVHELSRGLIVLETTCWETGDVLSDLLRRDGYATVWVRPGGGSANVHGVAAGIWEGRQLDEPEVRRLSAFCQRLAKDGAPVIALADFPRRDRCEVAYQAGAANVMAKPWLNADLLATLEQLMQPRIGTDADQKFTRAA
jgi:CheY-like chemotaxis protein